MIRLNKIINIINIIFINGDFNKIYDVKIKKIIDNSKYYINKISI